MELLTRTMQPTSLFHAGYSMACAANASVARYTCHSGRVHHEAMIAKQREIPYNPCKKTMRGG
jgi:hypothetical protein